MWDALGREEGFEDIGGVVRRQLNLKGIWQEFGRWMGWGSPFRVWVHLPHKKEQRCRKHLSSSETWEFGRMKHRCLGEVAGRQVRKGSGALMSLHHMDTKETLKSCKVMWSELIGTLAIAIKKPHTQFSHYICSVGKKSLQSSKRTLISRPVKVLYLNGFTYFSGNRKKSKCGIKNHQVEFRILVISLALKVLRTTENNTVFIFQIHKILLTKRVKMN